MMRRNRFIRKSRPWIAMAMAYALGWQMLLSAAMAGQMAGFASPGFVPICANSLLLAEDAPQDGNETGLHQLPCILCGVGLSAQLSPPFDLAAPVDGIESVSFRPRLVFVLPEAPPSPRSAQGPPALM
jgi:hypothetical protein